MTFTIQRLVNHRAVVSGTDSLGNSGSVVVDTEQWDELKQLEAHIEAHDDFDAAVQQFFKPLLQAAEALESTAAVVEDSLGYVVLEEGTEGVRATPEKRVRLTKDSIVLRLIEQGDESRLVWVNNELEILEVPAPAQPVTPAPVVTEP